MIPRLCCVPIFLSLLGLASAQDEATTLTTLAQRADVIVRATAIAVTDPTPEWHQLRFHVDAVLHGTVATEFELLEPAGACCGRSLFALQLGDERLFFLRRVGATLHPLGGARGVLPAVPALVDHVQAILGADNAVALTTVLANGLASAEARIADDAAYALSQLPQLVLDQGQRLAVTNALGTAVQRGSSRSAPLIDIAVRLGDAGTLDACLPIYLDTPRRDQAELLRRSLARGNADDLAARLPLHVDAEGKNALRAAELLASLPAIAARPALQRMLQASPHPRVQLSLTEALLNAGLRAVELRPFVPEPVLQLAEQRCNRPHGLKVVHPHGS